MAAVAAMAVAAGAAGAVVVGGRTPASSPSGPTTSSRITADDPAGVSSVAHRVGGGRATGEQPSQAVVAVADSGSGPGLPTAVVSSSSSSSQTGLSRPLQQRPKRGRSISKEAQGLWVKEEDQEDHSCTSISIQELSLTTTTHNKGLNSGASGTFALTHYRHNNWGLGSYSHSTVGRSQASRQTSHISESGSDNPQDGGADGEEDSPPLITAVGADLPSDATPEETLLAKFKHVYAGKGGWFGLRGSGASGNTNTGTRSLTATSAEGGIGGRDTSGLVRRGSATTTSAAAGIAYTPRHRKMPKAHYERYRKEIMRKLARSLQQQEEQNKQRTAAVAGVVEAPVGNGMAVPTTHASPNVTIPASWRLPVGWAGRNKGIAGPERRQTQRQRGKPDEHAQEAGATAVAGERSSNLSGAANVGSASTLKERTQFTRSWVNNSFGVRKEATDDPRHKELAYQPGLRVGGAGHLRIGHLLHLQRQDADGESTFAPPSGIQTEVIKPPAHSSSHGFDTSRTGFTSQSYPNNGDPSNGTIGRQGRKRKNLRTLAAAAQPEPGSVSSRNNMDMFSRMSLEAQAALKEMGLALPEARSTESDISTGEGEEQENVDENVEVPDLNNDIQESNKATVKIPTNAPHGRPGAKMPNLRNNSGENFSKKLAHSKENVLPNAQNACDHSVDKTGVNANESESSTKQEVETKKMSDDKAGGAILIKQDVTAPSVPKTGESNQSAESGQKQCSCKVRAGILLKKSTTREPSITVRVTSSRPLGVNGADTFTLDDHPVKISMSQVSRTRTRLPNINESPTGSALLGDRTESSTPFLGTHRQIPGIGQYKVSATTNAATPLSAKQWGRENTFEITPVGYDSRFEDIRTKEDDLDETPEDIKQKAIAKCSDWLKKYHQVG